MTTIIFDVLLEGVFYTGIMVLSAWAGWTFVDTVRLLHQDFRDG